ncbi:MAG: PmoA family protein [Candidatus Omnitrophica bacterium]|nr:PmoA family protein [Candidatus Omnitrophota bacterium]MCB9767163.1 PmoA family protein [Candidatus Omnitrophota bacterium]
MTLDGLWKTLSILALISGTAFAGPTLEFHADADGFAGGPVRFTVEGDLAKADVLALTDDNGRTVGYAQKDGDEFVALAPSLKRNETVSYALSVAKDAPNRVELTQNDDHTIDVTIDGTLFTSYHYAPDLRKPFLYPVLLEGKYRMTRGYPMEDFEGEPKDHIHHKSWWVAYGEVNGSDFWGESDKSNATQRTDEIAEVISGPVFGRLHAKNSWVGDEKKEVSEERVYTFYAGEGPDRLTDMKVTFTATDGDAVFHDTKEGGICSFRLNPKIDEKHGNGKMTNSEGQSTAAECWGKPAKWNDYSGTLDGQNLGVAVFDNPDNLRYPTRWHIRDYGLYGANCFGLSYFTEDEEKKLNGDYTIKDGDSLTFHYRVLIHTGNTEEANIEQEYQAYTDPASAVVKG